MFALEKEESQSSPSQWFDLQISISMKVIVEHFSLDLSVFEIFKFRNCDLENV